MLNDDTLSVSEIEMQKVNSDLNDLGSIRTIEAYKTDDPSNITKVAVARAGSQVVVTNNYVLQTPGINLRNVNFSSMSDEEKTEYIKQNSNTFAGKIENGKLSEADYNITLNDAYAVATINGTDVSNNIEFINYEVAEENSQAESRSAKAIPLPNTQERINGAAHGGDTKRAIEYAEYNFEYLKQQATETVVATNYEEFKTGLAKSGVIAIDVQGEIVFPARETNTGANSQIVIYSSNGLGRFNTSQNPFGFGDSPSRAINVVGTSDLHISNIKWIGRRGAEDWKNDWYTNAGRSTGLFDVDGGGTLNIYPGFEAKNHDSQGGNTSYVGWWGGLYRLEGSGSSVNIYGADIQNNSGSVGTIGLMNLAGSTTNIFDMNAQHNLGGWEGLFDVRDGLSATMNFYGGNFTENFGECRNRNSLYGYSWAVNKPSWGGSDQVNYYGDAVFENNWLIGNTIDSDGMYIKLQKSNAGTMHDSNAATQERTANAQIFYNLTKDSNISVGGTTWNQNIDNTYNSLKGKYGGIPMGKIAYTDPGLSHLADNPDIRGVKSDLFDGNKVNTITNLGKYVPIKKKVDGQWYLVLSRSYTELEVKAVDSNGNSIENGKYDYTNYILSNTETQLPISQIAEKYPVSIELQSNVQISGDMTSANDPTTFPQIPNKEDTEFTIKDNNNLSGNEDCIYKTTILVKYEDVKYYEVLANDASILSTNAQIAAGDINNKLIEWMDANIKELNTNTTLNDPSKIVVESACIDNIKAGTPGAYEVTFKFADDPTVSKTVLLTIVDDSSVNLDIRGINAFVTKNVAKTLTTDELIKQYMEVSAVYEGLEDISDELIVEYQPGDFEKIKGGVIGDYTITFRINNHETGMGGISATRTLGLHVVENEYTVSTDKQLIYEAHNLMMTVSEAQKYKKGNSYNMVQLLDKFEIKSKFIDKTGAVLNTWGADNGNEIGNGRPKETKDAVLSIDAVSYDNFAKNNDDDRVALSPWEIKFIINTHNSNVSGPGRGTEFNSLLTIRPDSSSPTGDNKAYIDAKDVTINKDDVDAQLPNNIDDLKTIMQMVAKDDTGNDKSNDAKVSLANPNQETDLFAHEIGTYQVVFRLDVGASVTRTLTIIDNNTTCDEDSGVCIVAQDFDIELSEILTDPTITENEIKTLAQVKAWSMIDGSDKFGDVVLDAEDYTTITSQTTAGTVSGVTFSIPDTSATKDVTATIVDNVTYTINANNFAVSVKDAPSLTADSVKSPDNANVSVSPVGQIADVTVDSAQLGAIQNAVVGQYPLTFTYKSVTKEIQVSVYDDNTNTDNDADKDQAQIFLTADSQVKLRTNNSRNNPTLKTVDEFNRDIVAGTNAKAWFLDGRVAQVIEFPTSEEVLDQPGLYIVKLVGAGYNYETSIKDVYVSVVDDNTNCNGEVCIAAQPIEILLSEASIYNEAMAKDRSKPIKAWYENKPDAITEDQIIADARDIAIVNEQTTETVLANGQKFQVQDAKPLTTGVNVTITEDKVGSFVIEASNNIVLSSDEAKNATSEQLRDKAGITITNENGVDVTAAMIGKVVANTTQLTAINTGVAQAYPLKFELNGSESNEIQVSVYDDNTATDTEDKEEANVFLTAVTPKQINIDEVEDYINNGWRTTHEVKAWAKDGTDLTTSVSASGLDTVKEEAGSYTLTLSVTQAGHTATKDVVVNVVDNDTTTNSEKYLKASNFELTTDWLSTNELTEAIAKTNANVKAWDSNGADLTASVTAKAEHLAKINEGKPGAFPLEFSVDGLSKQVVVSVKDNNTTCVDNVCITAKGFRKSIPANLNDESAKEDAEAHAWYTDSLETPTISVNQTQLSAINDATKPIVLPLTFTADSKVNATVAVTLTDENTVVDETIKEMISAHDFDATLEELASLDQSQTEALFKERSEVVAYPVIDGVVQIDPLTVTMTTTKPTTVGRHAVTFTTDNGTTKTVYVNVTDDNTECFGNVCISASDFDWQFTKRAELDQEATLTQSNAKAWYKDATTSPELTLSVEQEGLDAIHALSAAQATNPVVVKVSEDAKVTINVNVIDDNFTLTSKDAINLTRPTDFGTNNENITEDFIVGKFEATATNNQTQAAGTVKVSSDDLELIKSTQQGVVNITLFVEEQPEITKNVKVNVVPEGAVLGDSATITSGEVTINLSEVKGANSVEADYLIGKSGVTAWWNDGRLPNPTVILAKDGGQAQLDAINNAEAPTMDTPLELTLQVDGDDNAKVTIPVNIIDDVNYTVSANDFAIHANTLPLTSEVAKQKAGITITDAYNNDVTAELINQVNADSAQLGLINSVGAYELTFTLGENVSNTITVTVYDDNTDTDTEDKEEANVFLTAVTPKQINVDEVTDYINNGWRTTHEVKAWAKDGTDLTTSVSASGLDTVKAEAGSYTLTLSVTQAGHTATKDVVVNVVDNDTTTNSEKYLKASNFELTTDWLSTNELTEAIAKTNANVKAWDNNGQDLTASVTAKAEHLAKINEGKPGAFPLEFSVDGLSKQIVVSVKDNNTTCVDNVCITAKGFIKVIPANLNDESAKEDAEAHAWYTDSLDTPTISVNQTQLSAINGATKPIVLPLTFTADNKANATVAVTLTDDNTVVDETTKEMISAHDFDATLEELASLDESQTEALFKERSEVVAYPVIDGVVQIDPLTVTMTTTKPTTVGRHAVTFTTDKGTTKTVHVNVTDDNTECFGNVCISASNFDWQFTKRAELDQEATLTQSNAKAWYKDATTSPELTLSVEQDGLDAIHALSAAQATNPVVVKVSEEAKVTINVNVIDDNFTLTSKDAINLTRPTDFGTNNENITEDFIVGKFEATATNNQTQTAGTVKVSSDDLDLIKSTQQGVVNITLFVEEQPEITKKVTVNVVPEEATLGDSATIVAKDFSIKLSQVMGANSVTEDYLKGQAGPVNAWWNDGRADAINIALNTAEFNAINDAEQAGVLPLTFYVVEDPTATITINVTIIDNTQITLPGNDGDLGTEDDVVVKPNPDQDGNYPEENPDGSVDLPNGGDITFPNNPDNNGTVTVPGGSTVAPDGTITTPEGGVVKPNPDGNIELPGNDGDINNKPDNPVIKPGGNGDATINPDGSVTPDDDSQITYPNNPNNPGGSTTVPGGSTINPDGSVTLPGGDKPAIDTDEDGTITLPGQDDELGTDDDVAVKPDGGNTTVNPDGSVTPDNDSEITFPNNPDNDDITQIPGGSTVKPDGTVETPEGGVVRPNPDGGVELPGNDGKLPAPDNVDNPLIKPEGDGPIVVNPDGSVTLPDDENGNITYPNNPDNNGTVIVPGGSTVNPDGSVTLPGGDKPTIDTDEDGSLELPGLDGDLTKPEDNPVVKPENGNATINPDGSVTLPDDEKGEITFPNNPDNDDITQIPGGSTVKPDGTVELPDGGVVRPNPDGGVELPGNDGKLPAPDNTDNPVVKPEGDGPIVVNPDGSVTLPEDENGNITYPNNPDNNGTITIPGGSTVSPDGVVTTPEGGKVDTEEDGSIKVPGPNLNLGDEDDVVVKPGGNGDATINPDGSVTLPNGGTITPDNGNGQEWEVPNGTIVKPDGSIVLPGNNPNIDFEPTIRPNGDGSISVPGKDGVFDENGDNDHKVEGDGITFNPGTGDITMPNGGTVTRPGGEVVTVPNGTIVRPDGTIVQPAPEMNNVPVITIKDSADYTYDKDAKTITINQFTPFDVAQTATANDVEDGDLTDELVINVTRTKSRQTVNGNVDTSIAPSEWLVQYSVTDSKGATARKEITVIVIKDAQPPVINGTKDYEITVGSDLDLMAGVTATDYEGNDITANIVVTVTDPNGKVSNDINTMIIGTHTVEYSVTDKNGLTTTVTQTVTVKPIVLPGEDNIPGTDDDVIVTPNPDGDKPTTDGNGNVTLPDGGDVEFPGGGGVEVPDDSVITPGGEVIVPGGDNKPGTDDDVVIKPIPPTDEKPNGSVELPGDDGDINTKPDNPVVTPQGPNKPVIKPDGGVELPDGGDIEYPFNPDNPGGSIVVPPGSVVNPDGSVETPEGGKVDTDEDGTITLPGQDGNLGTDDDVQIKPGGNGDVTINPDGSVDLPNGGDITFPNNPDNNGTVTVPGGSTVAPDGTITTPEGGVVKPNPDGTVELPGQDGNLGTDDDVIVKPGGNGDVVVNPDGSVDLPNGGDVSFPNKPDAGMEVPGGSNVGQDGTVTAPNGDQSRPNVDGTITVPGHDGQFGTEDDGIIKPNGPNKPVLNPDGTITLPDGGVITFPGLGDCEIEILPGGHVTSTGVVTNPGADGIINTDDDEVLDPAVVCSIEVTEPQQPTKPEATHTGSASNVMMLFVTIAISSAVVLVLRRRK